MKNCFLGVKVSGLGEISLIPLALNIELCLESHLTQKCSVSEIKPMPGTLPPSPGATCFPNTLVPLELKAYHVVIYVKHLCAMIPVDNEGSQNELATLLQSCIFKRVTTTYPLCFGSVYMNHSQLLCLLILTPELISSLV